MSPDALDGLLGLERKLGKGERLLVAGARALGQSIHASERAQPDRQREQQQTAEPEDQPAANPHPCEQGVYGGENSWPSPFTTSPHGRLSDHLLWLDRLAQVAGELVGARPDLDGAVWQQQMLLLDHPSDQAGPARLVAGADAGAVVAVEVLVEEDRSRQCGSS